MNIVEIFKVAEKKLKNPRFKYPFESGYIEFYIPSRRQNDPTFRNYLYIVNRIGNSKETRYIGLVTSEGNLRLIPDILMLPIRKVAESIFNDPVKEGKLVGQKFCYCCFCGRELVNKNSITVGYGPICADNFGLPWEGTYEKSLTQDL